MNINDFVQNTLKAFAAGVGAAAVYLVGILGSGDGFADVTTVQWIGLIPVILSVYGITWTVPNTPSE